MTPHWTRNEAAERFPNAVTPLTWDFAVVGLHESLAHSLRVMRLPSFEGPWLRLDGNYVYANEAVAELTETQQVPFDSLDTLRAAVPIIRERQQWVHQLPVSWARDLDWYLLTLGGLAAADTDAMNEEELWRHINAIDAVGRRYFLLNVAISFAHAFLRRLLRQVAVLFAREEEGPALADSLTCFCETKTDVVNNDLLRLSKQVQRTPALRDLLSRMERRKVWSEGKLRAFPLFADELEDFLIAHGHREVDFDMYVPAWSGQPWVVLENVRLKVERGELHDAEERAAALRERQQLAERRLAELVPEDLRDLALELARLARTYTALDDLERYQTARLAVPFRHAIIELGRRFADGRVIEQPSDIFFLHRATIDRLIAGDIAAAEAEAEAKEQKRVYEENRVRTPSRTLDGVSVNGAPRPA
jgi:pyruvate,water dikinase